MNAASLEIFYPETGEQSKCQISVEATWHHSHIYDPDVAPIPYGCSLSTETVV